MPEVTSNADRTQVFPPIDNTKLVINDDGVLATESLVEPVNLQLGETIKLEVLTSEKLFTWEIKTGLNKLDKQGKATHNVLATAVGIPYYDAFALENTEDKAVILAILRATTQDKISRAVM